MHRHQPKHFAGSSLFCGGCYNNTDATLLRTLLDDAGLPETLAIASFGCTGEPANRRTGEPQQRRVPTRCAILCAIAYRVQAEMGHGH